MKKPPQISTEPDLLSGQVVFTSSLAFLTTRIIVTPPAGYTVNRRDIVVVSLDDVLGTYPNGYNLIPFGSIDYTGRIQIFLTNPGAPLATPDITISYMVLPRDSSP